MQLPDTLIGAADSVSSLHAIEHFGLGRYGDPIDYFGYKKAIENIHAILKEKGRFYFSVPIGPQRIEYNAHRVFSLKYLFNYLSNYFEIETLSIVDDKGDFHKHVQINDTIIENNYGCHYGCGIFELIKK
jgi:cyclopropane fatty-acyl-phospholipid synthase-like methyltransferase